MHASNQSSNDKGGCFCGHRLVAGGIGGEEQRAVVWDCHPEKEDKDQVEEDDSKERQFDGSGDGLAWVLGFSYCHAYELGAEKREDGAGHDVPKTEESTTSALCYVSVYTGRLGTSELTSFVGSKCSRIIPVVESCWMLVRSASSSQDKSEDYEPKHDQDFGAGQPKFKLSEESDAEVVDGDDCGEDYCYIDSSICTRAIVISFVEPVSDYKY